MHLAIDKYGGWVISDRYGSYNYFPFEKRQICWSHLLRDYERFAHSLDIDLSKQGQRLVSIGREVFVLVDAYKNEKISQNMLNRRVCKLSKEMQWIFKTIIKLPTRPKAQGVAKKLLSSFGMMWRFLEESFIEMTNNLAERQIRKYVTYRKKLLFTWSSWGNEYVERMLSMYLTCRLRKTDSFSQLKQAILA
ncbi:MAG: transposase [Burkholderiales bacterium]